MRLWPSSNCCSFRTLGFVALLLLCAATWMDPHSLLLARFTRRLFHPSKSMGADQVCWQFSICGLFLRLWTALLTEPCIFINVMPHRVCLPFIDHLATTSIIILLMMQATASSPAHVQRPLDVKDWSCDDVAAWMSSQGWVWRELDQYKARACEIGVTGRTLYDLEGEWKLLDFQAA